MVVLIFACESEQPSQIAGESKFLGYTVSEQTSLATHIKLEKGRLN